jgi:gamma-glutamylcyclotransferase (GGCT)/AIG2-like uncharacterized protein YtfP
MRWRFASLYLFEIDHDGRVRQERKGLLKIRLNIFLFRLLQKIDVIMKFKHNNTVTTFNSENPGAFFRLFVYGTLKRGYWNHDYFCGQACSVKSAVVWGRLYQLDAGFPALQVADSSVLEVGTSDHRKDAITQSSFGGVSFDRPVGDWSLVYGEILTFREPQHVIPAIDKLEGFYPGGSYMYKRVLVAAYREGHLIPTWAYRMQDIQNGVRLPDGTWPSLNTAELHYDIDTGTKNA